MEFYNDDGTLEQSLSLAEFLLSEEQVFAGKTTVSTDADENFELSYVAGTIVKTLTDGSGESWVYDPNTFMVTFDDGAGNTSIEALSFDAIFPLISAFHESMLVDKTNGDYEIQYGIGKMVLHSADPDLGFSVLDYNGTELKSFDIV